MSDTVFPWMREVFNTAALQPSGLAVAELYNTGSRAWDGNRVRANAPPDHSSIPSAEVPCWLAQVTGSTGRRELVALCPSPDTHLRPLKPLLLSQPAGTIPSAATRRGQG